jgi:hypothetical protein
MGDLVEMFKLLLWNLSVLFVLEPFKSSEGIGGEEIWVAYLVDHIFAGRV